MADEAPASSSNNMSDQLTTSTVRGVIREQFDEEVVYKEGELEQIEDRIRLAKLMLQRLRLGVLAQHYGVAGFYPTTLDYSKENVGAQETWDTFEKEFLEQQTRGDEDEESATVQEDECLNPSIAGAEQPLDLIEKDSESRSLQFGVEDNGEISISNGVSVEEAEMDTCVSKVCAKPELSKPVIKEVHVSAYTTPSHNEVSRFYTKKRIIIGNTSQYLTPGAQHTEDGSTHKWMVYIRGPQGEPDISHFVKAVRFFLHPSYHPNDIVRVANPPFHLTRLGWGEFPVRVQLEFCDRSNKPVDIIHNLVLDRTHTGQQTLGAETVVDLDITVKGKEQVGSSLANGIDIPLTVRNKENTYHSKTKVSALSNEKEIDISVASFVLHTQPKNEVLSRERELTMSPTFQSTPSVCSTESSGSVQLDHDYCTGVLVKQKVQRPSHKGGLDSSKTRTVVVTTNLDKCLHNAVQAIPLCGAPSEDFMLSANSLDQYVRWNLGKRRAAEWMRAVAVKRHVERKLRLGPLLTTKQVMQWCRRNGYTWLDRMPTSGHGFCKYCGCQLENEESGMMMDDSDGEGTSAQVYAHDHCREALFGESRGADRDVSSSEDEEEMEGGWKRKEEVTEDPLQVRQKLSTVTDCFELFSDVVEHQQKLDREESLHIEDQTVDVESLPDSSSARAREYHHHTPRFRVPQTPELKWIQQTAAGLGIRVYPAVIDRMYAHVVEHMIYMSCTRFLKTILMQAQHEAGTSVQGKLNQERILTPLHVHQAVRNLEQCDFLTNRYMGVVSTASVQSLSDSESSDEEE